MIIGIDIRSFIERSPSGVTEYTYQLLKNLFKIDKENKYLLFYNALKSIDRHYFEKLNFPNVEFKCFKIPNKILNSSILFFKSPKLDKLIGNVDLFFTPNLSFLSLSKNCRKIITAHDLSFYKYPKFYNLKSRWWHKFVKPKSLFQNFDKIIVVSENTKNDLIEIYNINPYKIQVIYSGINCQFFQNIDENKINKVKEEYNIKKSYILGLGNLEPRKNLESLISAFDLLKNKHNIDHQLILVGGVGWGEKDGIYKIAKKSKFYNDIKFLGFIPKKDIPYLYHLSSLFVYPSYYEGFGFPTLEAFAAGIPVIASHSSSLPEITGKASLLIDPYNVNEIAEIIYQVLTDLSLRDNLIKQGQEIVKRFSWDKTARETLELFRNIVS